MLLLWKGRPLFPFIQLRKRREPMKMAADAFSAAAAPRRASKLANCCLYFNNDYPCALAGYTFDEASMLALSKIKKYNNYMQKRS